MSRLENWAMVVASDIEYPYTAPELRPHYLVGDIYDDERWMDGTNVTTSSIQELDIAKHIAKTRNRTYELGARKA